VATRSPGQGKGMRGPQDVRRFLEQHQIPGRVLEFPHPTRTVDEAARAVNVEPQRILKTLLFLARKEPFLVLAGGTTRVDYRVLARHLGLSRKKIPALLTYEEVYAGGGAPNALLCISPRLLQELTQAQKTLQKSRDGSKIEDGHIAHRR